MQDGKREIRLKQEDLFAMRAEADKALKEASMEMELAALGGVDQKERLMRAAHRIGTVGSRLIALAGQTNFIVRSIVGTGSN